MQIEFNYDEEEFRWQWSSLTGMILDDKFKYKIFTEELKCSNLIFAHSVEQNLELLPWIHPAK